MYQEFYGLREKPFVLTPDPQYLYLSESHRTAIDSLHYGIEQREGFIIITGDIGTGKTTICRAFLERLDKNVKTAVIFNSLLSEGKLLESILQDFGFPSKGRTKHDLINSLNQSLLQSLSRGENAVLLIDEAQNLSIPVLEQVRMLSNLETDKEKLLQIILFGQLELDQKLRSNRLKQLNQRIAIRHHLLPLTQVEMESYIYQRLMIAGAQGGINFSKSALNEIYKFSKGIPRLINLLCDRALLGGFVEQTYQIDRRIIKKAKESLLGEEKFSKPFFSWVLPKKLIPLRIALWVILVFLLASFILMNQSYFFLFQNAKHLIWGRIQSAILLDKEWVQNSEKNEPTKDVGGASQEASK
jgi:general secretion pathway protein A